MKFSHVNADDSDLCNPQLRDPLTVSIGYMVNPTFFRAACRFTVEVFDQAVFLEGDLQCCVMVNPTPADNASGFSSSIPIRCGRTMRLSEGVIHSDPSCHRCNPSDSTLRSKTVNSNATSLVVTQLPNITSVDYLFLPRHCTLRHATFQGLSHLKTIGDGCLKTCASLESLKVVDCPLLWTIQDDFAVKCTALKSAVFRDLPQLEQIGDQCLSQCSQLESFTLSKMPSLRTIGASFLAGCTRLGSATFDDLPRLQRVGEHWLKGCTELREVGLATAPALRAVGAQWLGSCPVLSTVRFSGVPNLAAIGSGMMGASGSNAGKAASTTARTASTTPSYLLASVYAPDYLSNRAPSSVSLPTLQKAPSIKVQTGASESPAEAEPKFFVDVSDCHAALVNAVKTAAS